MTQALPPNIEKLPANHPLRRRYEASKPTQAQLVAQYTSQIDSWINQVARSMKYNDIVSAVSYKGDANPVFAAEADALSTWRSSVWTTANQLLAEVASGTRPVPTNFKEVKDLLPVFVKPAI